MRPHGQLSLWDIKWRFLWSQKIRYYNNSIKFSEKRKEIIVNRNISNNNIFNMDRKIPHWFYLCSFETELFWTEF